MSYRVIKESDEGIVLVKRKVLDSDLVYIILTKSFGKIAVLAKGVQKITSKRISALQTGNIVRIIFSQKQDSFRYLRSVELVSHLSPLKKDLGKLQHLYTLLYMVERMLPDGQSDIRIYELCKLLLVRLTKEDLTVFSITKAMSELLMSLGYGTCSSYEECVAMSEDIMGKKLPTGIV